MRLSSYVTNVLFALAYSAIYVISYFEFLNYHFGYFGFDIYQREYGFLALSVFICVVPILCYRGFRALSSVLAVFTYVLVYIPIILTFALGSSRSLAEILLLQGTFMLCMCLLFIADVITIQNPLALDSTLDLTGVVFLLTVASTLYVLFVYRSNLRMVSFTDVYEQRFANAELGSGIAIRYVASWLYTVLIPLCLAYGLIGRNYKYFGLGVAACVTLYMATAAKSALVLPIVYVGLFGLLAKNRLRAIYPLFIGALSLSMSFLLAVKDTKSIAFMISSLVLVRTIGTGGLLTMQYYDFFSSHPQTSYTHINLVRMIADAYPYGTLEVGQVVGQYYYNVGINANANFWAMDGIAALGLLGVPVVTIPCALLFIVMNAVTRGYNRLFVVLCFLPFLVSLLNTSLFSSMWSGGAFFLLLFFLFNKRNVGALTQRTGATVGAASFPLDRDSGVAARS